MKKVLLFISFVIFCIVFIDAVHADTTFKWPSQCVYQGKYTDGIGWTTATISSDGYSTTFSKIEIYDEEFFGKNLKKLKNYTRLTVKLRNGYNVTNLKYKDKNNSKQELQITSSTYSVPENISTCPEYMIVINSGYAGGSDIYVFVGDESLKNYLESSIETSSGNTLMTYGKAISLKDLAESVDDEDIYGDSTCDGMLGQYNATTGEYAEDSVGWLLQWAFNIIKIAAVILVFVFSAIDFAKAIIDQDGTKLKVAINNTIKRFIIGMLVFLLPYIVDIIIGWVDSSTCGIN